VENIDAWMVLVEKNEGKNHMEDLHTDQWIELKWFQKIWERRAWTAFIWPSTQTGELL